MDESQNFAFSPPGLCFAVSFGVSSYTALDDRVTSWSRCMISPLHVVCVPLLKYSFSRCCDVMVAVFRRSSSALKLS